MLIYEQGGLERTPTVLACNERRTLAARRCEERGDLFLQRVYLRIDFFLHSNCRHAAFSRRVALKYGDPALQKIHGRA